MTTYTAASANIDLNNISYSLARVIEAGDRIAWEEVCEALNAKDEKHLRKELVQVAAMAVKWIADLDSRARAKMPKRCDRLGCENEDEGRGWCGPCWVEWPAGGESWHGWAKANPKATP